MNSSAKRWQTILVLLAGSLVVLALLTVFAIELADTQAKSRRDVISRVHERAVLAGALIDSLFQTVQQQIPQYQQRYGARTVSTGTMDRYRANNAYGALLDPSGRVLAASSTLTPQQRATFARSTALMLVRAGHPYGLGNLAGSATGVFDLAVQFPTRFGPRILLSGVSAQALGPFLSNELRQIPGVKGAHNYVIDGNDAVLASTYAGRPIGYRFTQPAQISALNRAAGQRNGHYYVQVNLKNSTWRIVLSAPEGPLFASVSGLRKWVPWIIFVAFALVAAATLVLGRRVLQSSAAIRSANAQLETVNSELAATNEALEHRAVELARSNAELAQFASIASHDLQEPLRKVRTFTDQLAVTEAGRLSEKGRDYLERTNSAAARMQRLIQDLLAFSRVTTQGRPFAPVDLAEITHEVLDDLSAEVESSGATVHVGELPTFPADVLQMRQLIQNLLSNAVKFRRAGVAPEVWIEGSVQGGRVRLMVRDNGIGFEPRYADRIFRVFERLHGRTEYAGTGIGLAVCQKIVQRHGGTIVADGKPGAGATFTVTLPANAAEPAAMPPSLDVNGAVGDREEARVPA